MHVDKLMPYHPDFGEELDSWIQADHPTRYRDQGEQTASPTIQSQLTAVIDIPPQAQDPVPGSIAPPSDPLNPPLEPDKMLEADTTKSAET